MAGFGTAVKVPFQGLERALHGPAKASMRRFQLNFVPGTAKIPATTGFVPGSRHESRKTRRDQLWAWIS